MLELRAGDRVQYIGPKDAKGATIESGDNGVVLYTPSAASMNITFKPDLCRRHGWGLGWTLPIMFFQLLQRGSPESSFGEGKSCPHSVWQLYNGFTDRYEFCTSCDQKRVAP